MEEENKQESIYYFLKKEEIDVLIESLDSWVHRSQAGEMMGVMFEGLMSDKITDAGKLKLKQKRAEEYNKKKEKQTEDKETATLIKSKLIMLKREIAKR